MADLLRNSNKRRKSETNHEPEAKHRKQIGVEVTETDAEGFTNICNELIDRIFDFLDLQSLLNVADTCKRLQIAAAAKYGQRFGRYTPKLRSENFWLRGYSQQGSRFENHLVEVFGLTGLPFLRCFGAQISKLEVDATYNKHVTRYINQYCADNLTMLHIEKDSNPGNFTIENCPKPFIMVEEVNIFPMRKELSYLAYWFPNVRRLRFFTIHFDYDISSAVFPRLQELSFTAEHNSYSEKRRIERFIRANQHVRYLRMNIQKPQFLKLLEMISGHTMILELGVSLPNVNSKPVKRAQLLRFARQHREVVKLDFLAFLLKANDAIALIRRLNSLKSFTFRLKDHAEYHYLVNQLHFVFGFMFVAKFTEIFTPTITAHLKFNP